MRSQESGESTTKPKQLKWCIRIAHRWFVSFKVETEPQNTEKLVDVVGVDLGIKSLATLSTGEVFEGAKSYN